MKNVKAETDRPGPKGKDRSIRERVLSAAFAAFRNRGFAGASTLEIATRAKVSKRDLYALFDNKNAMLVAAIKERARRMRGPLELPAPQDREGLAATLAALGTSTLRGVCHPDVLAVYRLALASPDGSGEVARALDSGGREANHAALAALLANAQARGLLGAGEPSVMAGQFFALLWGDLLIRILLRVRDAPTPAEIDQRSRAATEALMLLYPDGG